MLSSHSTRFVSINLVGTQLGDPTNSDTKMQLSRQSNTQQVGMRGLQRPMRLSGARYTSSAIRPAAALPRRDPTPQQGSLRLFLDTADVSLWHKWASTGLLYGAGFCAAAAVEYAASGARRVNNKKNQQQQPQKKPK